MADWPDQPSLPAGLPYGYVTPPSYGDIQGFSSPFTAQQIDALRIKFQEALMQIIVLAVNGFFDAGEAAFDQLAAWAQQLGAAANSAADLIADLLDSLLGTGHTISDLVDYFQGIANDASNSINYIGTLIAGLGGTVIADVVTVITDIQTNSGLAVSQLAALITGVSGAAIADVVTAINNGVTALTRIASLIAGVSGASTITDVVNSINAATTKLSALISGVSGTTITDVVTTITNATTNIQTLLNNLYNIFSGTTGNTGKTLANVLSIGQTFFTGAASGATQIAALISGLGGTVVADVVAVINAISAAIQALKNSLAGIFNPAGVGDISLSTLVTNIQTGLQGILPAIVQNANGTASVLSTAAITINNNGTATYNQVAGSVHALVDQANGTMATVSAALQAQAQAAIANAGSNLTAVAANTQTLINSLFGGFGIGAGAAVPASTPVQATQAVVSAQQNIANNAAGLAALNALLTQTQNGGGLSVSINFSSYADGALPGIFTPVADTVLGMGTTPVISGGYAVDPGPDTGTGHGELYNVATTTGDNQLITGIFAGVTSNGAFLLGRANAAGTSYVTAFYSYGTWYLYCAVAGTLTLLTSASDTFTNGAAYSLVCGTGAVGNRNFQILKNGTALNFSGGSTTFTEVGTTSQMGALYRSGGFALLSTAKLSQWTFVDNTPPAAVGSGFRAYRSSATGVALSNTGLPAASLLANSFFDTTEYCTSDITPALATANKITLSVSGWYAVTIKLYFPSSHPATDIACALYKNGTLIRVGGDALASGCFGVENKFNVYCAAGDYLQPGYSTVGTITIAGESTGVASYFEVAFMNRGTLS